MTPPLIDIRKLHHEEREVDILTAIEDLRLLVCIRLDASDPVVLSLASQMQQRRTIAGTRFIPKTVETVPEEQVVEAPSNADLAEAMYRAEAERDLDEEEELFNVEESISRPTSYNWEDKYRPRKPKYFNRVHTGYEWNKYNQTHYE